ncbi:5658_t:CDS:2 [Gigaspora rosea]|nr:5658_t:CDS:2 [Gigaspora rosea]
MYDFQRNIQNNSFNNKIKNKNFQDSIQTSQPTSQPLQTSTLLRTNETSSSCHDCCYFDQTDSYKIQQQSQQSSWLTNRRNIDSFSHSGDFELFGEQQDKKMDINMENTTLPSFDSFTPSDSINFCGVDNSASISGIYSFGINDSNGSIGTTDNMNHFSIMNDSNTNSLTNGLMVSLSSSVSSAPSAPSAPSVSSVLDPPSIQKSNNQIYLQSQPHSIQQLPSIHLPPINLPPINNSTNNSTIFGSSTSSSLISFKCFLSNISNISNISNTYSYSTNNNIFGSSSQSFNFNVMSSQHYPRRIISSIHRLPGTINVINVNTLSNSGDQFICLLVNRQWCRIVVPILWQAPNPGFKKSKFLVRTYLLCLSQDMKRFLKANNIPVPPAPRRCLPAFDYPYFLRKVTDKFISGLTEAWLFKKWSVEKGKATLHLNRILHELFFSRAQRINSLTFDDDAIWPFNSDQPLSCLKYLTFLKISISNHSDHNPVPFLNSLLISSCSRIKMIEIDIDSKFHDYNDSIVQLIKSQRELEKISLNRCHQILKPLIQSLKSCTNSSLKSLRFNRVNFESFKEIFSDDFINSLKSIELHNSLRLDNKYFKNFICKTHNLSQFEFCDYNSIDPFVLDIIINLLTLNNNLKCLVLRFSGEYSELVGSIIKHCPKLEYLELPQIRKCDVLSILSSCLHLKYFNFIIDFSLDCSSFLQISRLLPKDLRNLIITEREKRPAFDILTYKLFFELMTSKNLKTLYTSGTLLDNLYSRDYQKVFIEHNIKWSYEEIPRLY